MNHLVFFFEQYGINTWNPKKLVCACLQCVQFFFCMCGKLVYFNGPSFKEVDQIGLGTEFYRLSYSDAINQKKENGLLNEHVQGIASKCLLLSCLFVS